MQILNEKSGEAVIFKLNGRLDSNTSPEFGKKIEQIIKAGSKYIIIEFKNLEYLSSAGLREFLNTAKALKKMDGRLVLCAMPDYIREIIEVAGFDTILLIVPTVDDALKKIKTDARMAKLNLRSQTNDPNP